MKKNYFDLRGVIITQGIYKITNELTGEAYIGKSSNIENRITNHFQDLENNQHHNKGLQQD